MTVVVTGFQPGHAPTVWTVQHLGQGSDTRWNNIHLGNKEKPFSYVKTFQSSLNLCNCWREKWSWNRVMLSASFHRNHCIPLSASTEKNAIPSWNFRGRRSQTHYNLWQTSPHNTTSSETWNLKAHQMKLCNETRFTTLSISIPCEGCAFCCWAILLSRREWKRQNSHICFPSEVGRQNAEYIW